MHYEEKYMHRALGLAARGLGGASPNPMVGCVIVSADGRTIGEGWHRVCGEGHAEVNALASVKDADRPLLADATAYVTLEPCSHWGRTPPCALKLIDTGIGHVVVGVTDPFPQVSGRGIAMLREAGVEVVTGVCHDECMALNAIFMSAHTRQRSFVTLKWAQSADGYMDVRRTEPTQQAYRFSGPTGQYLVHRLRGIHDAVLVGHGTVVADNPRLDNRLWPQARRQPQPVVLTRAHELPVDAALSQREPLLVDGSLPEVLKQLYDKGITSILVEGGAHVLGEFIAQGLWDAARVETAPVLLGQQGAAVAPHLDAEPIAERCIDGNTVRWYANNPLFTATHPMVEHDNAEGANNPGKC